MNTRPFSQLWKYKQKVEMDPVLKKYNSQVWRDVRKKECLEKGTEKGKEERGKLKWYRESERERKRARDERVSEWLRELYPISLCRQ